MLSRPFALVKRKTIKRMTKCVRRSYVAIVLGSGARKNQSPAARKSIASVPADMRGKAIV
jgi:hypothetical protein